MLGKMGGDGSAQPDFGGLMKEFEKMAGPNSKSPGGGNSSGGDPFAKLFEGLGSPDQMPGGDDAQFMDMFKGLMSSLNNPD